jgi:hypothetical protein
LRCRLSTGGSYAPQELRHNRTNYRTEEIPDLAQSHRVYLCLKCIQDMGHVQFFALGQRLGVKVLDRQDNETDYSYVVPGHFSSYSNASANCFGSDSSLNCSVSGTTNGIGTPPHQVSYHVRAATFTLLLPDGRGVIVNCESKVAERMAGPSGNHRGCRIPLVEDLEAEFHGDKAKLEWVVSLDGKKKQSETYNILAILDKPKMVRSSLCSPRSQKRDLGHPEFIQEAVCC